MAWEPLLAQIDAGLIALLRLPVLSSEGFQLTSERVGPPAALPAAAPAVAPLTELPEAIVLLRALADVFAATGAYAFEGAEQALGPLEAAVEGRSLSAWKATRELGDVRTSMST